MWAVCGRNLKEAVGGPKGGNKGAPTAKKRLFLRRYLKRIPKEDGDSKNLRRVPGCSDVGAFRLIWGLPGTKKVQNSQRKRPGRGNRTEKAGIAAGGSQTYL